MKRVTYVITVLVTLLACHIPVIYAGEIVQYGKWLDTEGKPINAHGGGMLYHDGKYYWYGEYKKGKTYLPSDATWERYRTDVTGVSCYSSTDLYNWKFEGVVLKADTSDPASDIHPSQVLERPKVVYNKKTGKFVMWFHADSADYTKAAAGVAVGDSPVGPFKFLGSMRPNNSMSRDQTVFVDDDGKAYQFASSENNETMYINELTDDYLKPTGRYTRNFIGMSREAPAVFKHDGRYYVLSSGCSGWDPNSAQLAVADSIMGKWTVLGDPCEGPLAEKTFYAQSTYVVPVVDCKDTYIAMFDRWNKKDLEDSRYVWLPLEIKDGKITIPWRDKWDTDSLCPKHSARTPREEILGDKMLSTSNHRVYPVPGSESSISCAPEGYAPFHISTYARHGSRYLMKRQFYTDAIAPLKKAEKAGVITDTGREVKKRLEKILARADEGRYGELTPTGVRQHRGIANRMFANFPEIFTDSVCVDAKSTDVMRCVMSMMAECLELQSLNPSLKITHDASQADMYYMNDIKRSDSLQDKYKGLRDRERKIRKSRLDPTRVFGMLYSDPQWVKKNIKDPQETYYNLFYVASNMQSHEDEGLDLMWIFTPEECCDCWLVNNVDWYLHSGNSPLTAHEMPFQHEKLLMELIKDGDIHAANHRRSASLRFGHESMVLPTVVLLGIDGFDYETDDVEAVSDHWAAYKVFPMAANIQMVFYEKPSDPEADVLVRVLLNENDARLPLTAASGTFYKWSDFSAFYKNKLGYDRSDAYGYLKK